MPVKKTKESLLDIESKAANLKEDIVKHATSKKKITTKQIDEHAESRTKDFKEEISKYTKSITKEAKDTLDKYTEGKLSQADLEIDGHANRKIKDAKEEIDHHADSKNKEAREAIDIYVESRIKKGEAEIDDHDERTIEHAKKHLKQHASEEITEHARRKTTESLLDIESKTTNSKEDVDKHAASKKKEIDEHASSKARDMTEDFDKHADNKTKEAMAVIREQMQNAKEEIDEKKLSVISELQKMKMIISEMSTHEIADIFHPRTASELQRHLLELYKQSSYYLKTEVSPFLPDEEDYLDDVFVQPIITRKIKTIPKEEKPVESYEDFFSFGTTRLKNIILSADPGMGKTTICKRIISLWCEAHQPNDAVREYKNKHRDIETMKTIKFLFYVSLPHSPPDVRSIEEMIRRQLLDTVHYQTLRNVLENEPENCLVMLDGLDEWTAPNITPSSPRIPPGLPDREVKSQYTTILATRPFKLEKIGPFQSDVEIKLHALDKQRIKEHIQSVYAKLDIYCTMNSAEVYDELKKRNIDNLLNVPLILKMIICLFIDDKTIHESITGIYMCITETLLDRASQKITRSDTKQTENPGAKLPECFKEQTKCKELADILIQLSEFSFDLLFKQGKKSVFNMKSSDPRFPCLSQCLQIGLLSKSSLRGRSARDRYASVSFIHETFQEFFSALFISVFDTDENIELLLKSCDTLVSFLGLNRFFMFVTEMNAPLLKRVCKHVADIVDARMDGFRNMENTTYIWPYNDSCTCLLEAVQVGITNCIGQIVNDKRLRVDIRDIFIDTSKNIIAPIENIEPDSVTSMHICQTKEIPKKVVDFMHTCSKVQCIWYYKPSVRVKWQDLFPDVNLFERYSYLETLYLRKCNLGHTAVAAILLHPNIKIVNFNEIHTREDGKCTCSAIHGRQTEIQRNAATKINTLCIVQSSEVLPHVDAAPNLQTLVWDHSEPCFSNAKTILNFLSTSSSLRTVTIRGLNKMTLSADKNAIIDRICVELSRLTSLENLKLKDCNLSSYQKSMIPTFD